MENTARLTEELAFAKEEARHNWAKYQEYKRVLGQDHKETRDCAKEATYWDGQVEELSGLLENAYRQ